MVRMSNPRTLYSPPRKNFSKIGSCVVWPYGRMYSVCTRKPIDVFCVNLRYQTASLRFIQYDVLPPMPARSKPTV